MCCVPALCPTLTPTRSRAEDLKAPEGAGERDSTGQGVVCATFIVPKEALWVRGGLPTLLPWATHSFGERAQIKWRVSQSTGEGHRAALQRGCPAKTESPQKLSSHSPEVGPGLRCQPPCLPPTTPSSALAPPPGPRNGAFCHSGWQSRPGISSPK